MEVMDWLAAVAVACAGILLGSYEQDFRSVPVTSVASVRSAALDAAGELVRTCAGLGVKASKT